MHDEQLPELPKELEKYVDKPYGGLFGDNVQTKIIEEIVADPYRNYRPRYFEETIGVSPPSVRTALNNLTNLGLLEKDISDSQHPLYRPNMKSKKIVALTFLSYASVDDRDGSDCMNEAIVDYFMKALGDRVQPVAMATIVKYNVKGLGTTWTNTSVITADGNHKENIILAEGKA